MDNNFSRLNPSLATGTSFWGTTIKMPYKALVTKLGKPHVTYESGGKVQYEWCFRGPDNRPVTLYDWKQYGTEYPKEWHVGGLSQGQTEAFLRWFKGEG